MPDLIVDQGPITRLTMNRPEVLNAFSTAFGDQILDALTEAGRDPDCKVVILRGNGRAFSSGDDIKEGARARAAGEESPFSSFTASRTGLSVTPTTRCPRGSAASLNR